MVPPRLLNRSRAARLLALTFLIGRDRTIQGYAPGMLKRSVIEPPIANLVAGRPADAGARGAGRP